MSDDFRLVGAPFSKWRITRQAIGRFVVVDRTYFHSRCQCGISTGGVSARILLMPEIGFVRERFK